MTTNEIRQKFLTFFAERGHKIVPSSSLIPNDPSVLLTTAGMQQFKSYYLDPAAAEKDFGAKNVASIQKSFRTSDIDEVGDDTHLTFFEMLGNFSFGYKPGSPAGGYFKKEAIKYAYEFITQELNLPIAYVTIFKGSDRMPKDEESGAVWHELDITDVREKGMEDVFWGPTGSAGPCGPATEIYCKNAVGHEVEVWNLVFNQFFFAGSREELLSGVSAKKLEPVSTLGVDTGMGLERLAMVAQKKNNIFETDLFAPIIEKITFDRQECKSPHTRRIVADHLRAAAFLIADGVEPANKGAGYVLRRLLRRIIFYEINITELLNLMVKFYHDQYPELDRPELFSVFTNEKNKFNETLTRGLRELDKFNSVDAPTAFKLFETLGLPYEVIKDYQLGTRAKDLKREDFDAEFKKHQEISRAGMDKKFAGGLADHEPATVRLHTAHHLLLGALKQVFGAGIKQRGSNINQERLRFDFSFERKLTENEKRQVEDLVNQKIKEDLPVVRREMSRGAAQKLGAEMEFGQKYGETVSVYSISLSSSLEPAFSLEFCGGPHVARTGELIGVFKITKEEAVSAGVRRIKAVLT